MVGVPLQLSLAVTLPVLGAGTWLAQATVTDEGQVIVGGVPSNTVITCVQVAVLKQASVARYVRVTINRLAHVIFTVTSPRCAIVTLPPQLSELETLLVFGAGIWLAQVTVTGAGQVMLGTV